MHPRNQMIADSWLAGLIRISLVTIEMFEDSTMMTLVKESSPSMKIERDFDSEFKRRHN